MGSNLPSIFIEQGGFNIVGKVGIGTSIPTSLFTVAGTIETKSGGPLDLGGIKFPDGTIQTTKALPCSWLKNSSDIYFLNGKVGIGMNNPSHSLSVDGSIIIPNSTSSILFGTGGTNPFTGNWGITYNGSGLKIYQPNYSQASAIFVKNNYRIGIWNDHPSAALDVCGAINTNDKLSANSLEIWSGLSNTMRIAPNGEIWAQAIWVQPNDPWDDYVFDKDYKLMPISEVQNYINLHKHLPGIKSANEITNQSVNLMEMNQLLLQKIEELTLYIIEQNSKIVQLQKNLNIK